MYKYSFLLSLLIFMGGLSACQSKAKNTNSDTWKITNYAQLNDTYFKNLSFNSIDSLIDVVNADVSPVCRSFAFECLYYRLCNLSHTTDKDLMHFLDLAEKKLPRDTVIAFCFMQRGHLFTQSGQLDSVLPCLEKSFYLYQKAGLRGNMADVLRRIGGYHYYRADYVKSISILLDALTIFENLYGDNSTAEDGGRRFELMLELANIYSNIKDYNEANKWYLRAYKLTLLYLDKNGHKIEVSVKLARNYLNLKNIDSTQFYVDKVDSFQKASNSDFLRNEYYFLRGQIKMETKDCTAALADINTASKYDNINTNVIYFARFAIIKGSVFECLNQLDSAFYYYTKAAASTDFLMKVTAYAALSTVAQKRGDNAAALFHKQRSEYVMTQLSITKKKEAIAQLQIKVALEKREKTIKQQKHTEQISYLSRVIFFLVLVIGLGFFWFSIVK